MRKKLVIMGGIGTGTVIAAAVEDIIEASSEWEILGFLNDHTPAGEKLGGYPVLGKVDDAKQFNADDCFFIFALITTKKAHERIERLYALGIPDEKYATLKHPSAVVPRNVKLGYGVTMMPGVIISPDVVIGNHNQIFANAFIGHNTKVGSYCLIANSASIGSYVNIEDGVHIGSNSSIIERVTLGKWSVIGLGAVVVKDVPPFTTVVGNPAKPIGKVNE